MTKVNGSLGFTLRKEDHSALGHYVRALVREPALSDGRIQPGDRIVAVCNTLCYSFRVVTEFVDLFPLVPFHQKFSFVRDAVQYLLYNIVYTQTRKIHLPRLRIEFKTALHERIHFIL